MELVNRRELLRLGCAGCAALLLETKAGAQRDRVVALVNAHAHNDYEHTRPLLDALDNGFCSVEADVHLIEGKLLVAHDGKDARPERTLQALYLDPLRTRARRNRGRIYPNGPRSLTLLVDVKTDAPATYAALRVFLAPYKDLLTEWRGDTVTPRAVTIVLSGNRPTPATFAAEPVRYAAYDGRLSDLDKGISPHVMPLVSQDWAAVSTWRGEANTTLPPAERARIAALVEQAHKQGYRLRFWATPDTLAAWQTLRDLRVDLINTDNLDGLRRFLLRSTAT